MVLRKGKQLGHCSTDLVLGPSAALWGSAAGEGASNTTLRKLGIQRSNGSCLEGRGGCAVLVRDLAKLLSWPLRIRAGLVIAIGISRGLLFDCCHGAACKMPLVSAPHPHQDQQVPDDTAWSPDGMSEIRCAVMQRRLSTGTKESSRNKLTSRQEVKTYDGLQSNVTRSATMLYIIGLGLADERDITVK